MKMKESDDNDSDGPKAGSPSKYYLILYLKYSYKALSSSVKNEVMEKTQRQS